MPRALARSALGVARTTVTTTVSTPCTINLCQKRTAAVSLLDKLHRKQRQQDRDERMWSCYYLPSPIEPVLEGSTTLLYALLGFLPPPSNPLLIAIYIYSRSSPANLATGKKSALRASSIQPPTTTAAGTSTTTASTPYHIHRTPSHQLPVYIESKNGGNLHQTRVRKIEGNVHRLRDELRTALGLDGSDEERKKVTVNFNTKHVVVKGWRKPEVEAFLKKRGF